MPYYAIRLNRPESKVRAIHEGTYPMAALAGYLESCYGEGTPESLAESERTARVISHTYIVEELPEGWVSLPHVPHVSVFFEQGWLSRLSFDCAAEPSFPSSADLVEAIARAWHLEIAEWWIDDEGWSEPGDHPDCLAFVDVDSEACCD